MALQPVTNNNGFIIGSTELVQHSGSGVANQTIDAAGESQTAIGRLVLQGGSGSKTISSSGGKIYWMSGGTITFANGTTNLRIGIQDVGANGLEDGTFDVQADLVGGTDTIATQSLISTAMESGSKTVSHGDIIAISVEMTARGGTDSVQIRSLSGGPFASAINYPYKTQDTGGGPTKNLTQLPFLIEFDDGTIGWIEHIPLWYHVAGATSNFTFNINSATDEYAAVFQLPFKASLNGAALYIGSIASTDNFEVILYSNPFGTPVAEQTITVDPDFTGSTSTIPNPYWVSFSSFTILPNTEYAIALRPTTANDIMFGYFDLGSSNTKFKRVIPFGENLKTVGRVNQSGAFSVVQTYYMPAIWLSFDKFDDGASPIGQAKVVQAFGSY